MSDDDEVFELDADLDLAHQQIRKLKADLAAARAEADRLRKGYEDLEKVARGFQQDADRHRRDLDIVRAEADRLRAAVEEVLEFARCGGDPRRALVGLLDAFDATSATEQGAARPSQPT